MKRILILIFISFLIIPACRKSNIPVSSDINGSWKLIQVYDKNTATTNYPPAGANTDVIITFLKGNGFIGHTLKNTISGGTYTLNANQIIFESFSMTKMAEDPWGGSFLVVLNACLLQSVSPCAPSAIAIQGNIMRIVAPMRYDITLQKL